MRATSATVATALAALLLTGCSDDGSDAVSDTSCKVGEVGFKVGPGGAPAAGAKGVVLVTITKKGAVCTLDGVPGAQFHTSGTWEFVPSDTAPERKLTVSEGSPASFTLTYVRGEPGSDRSLAVKNIAFFLPGANTTRSFKWPYGDVAVADTDVPEPDAMLSGWQTVDGTS